ncbi:MAG: DUF1566 domain-containing protein [Gammaproteobacteria bacterium]|nr:DUF1566 domain-containing protein [Gammaproteobacteria bacterium]
MKKFVVGLVTGLSLFSISGLAQAALWDRGGGLIYDDDLNITWLQDATYAKTLGLGYEAKGIMLWDDANTWVADLEYYDSERNVTYDDWRLPITPLSDTSNSEMEHLYSVEGVFPANSSYPYPFFGMGDDNYWSSETSTGAYNFRFQTGQVLHRGKDSFLHVWAVRPGDVSSVPVPAAVWLFGSGLIGLAGIGFRCRITFFKQQN